MNEENKKESGVKPETLTMQEVEKLLSSREESLKKEFQGHIAKLNEENKNKRLESKDLKGSLADILGLNKDELTDTDVLKNSVNELKKQQDELKTLYEKERQEKETLVKRTRIKEIADKLGFADASDALSFLPSESEDIEADLNAILNAKPYLKKQNVNIGGISPNAGNKTKDNQQAVNEALKARDAMTAISLINKQYNI